jgi:hypothetical protein
MLCLVLVGAPACDSTPATPLPPELPSAAVPDRVSTVSPTVVSAPTGTTVSSTASPGTRVVRAWATPVTSGVDVIDKVVASLSAADAAGLAPLIVGMHDTCGRPGPTCPPGTAPGAAVRTFAITTCDGDPPRLADVSDSRDDTFAISRLEWAEKIVARGRYLVGVWRTRPPYSPTRRDEYVIITMDAPQSERGVLLLVTELGINRGGWLPPCGPSGARGAVDAENARSDQVIPPPVQD